MTSVRRSARPFSFAARGAARGAQAAQWNAALAALHLLNPSSRVGLPSFQRAKALEQLWRNQGSLLTTKHFAQAIRAFGRERRWQEGNCLLEEMSKRQLGPCKYSYSALLSACASASAWQRAMQILTSEDAGFEPDLIALTSALSACEKASRWEQAAILCAEAERRKLALDLVAFNTVISSCGKGFAWAAALAYLDRATFKGLSPDVVSFSAAVSACERGQEWQRALQLLGEARKRGKRLDAILLGACISACEKGRQWEHALSLLTQASELHVVPDTTSFNGAIAALGKSFLWEKALWLLHAVPAPDVTSFDTALAAAASVSQWTQVLVLLDQMSTRHHFEATDFSYMSVLTALTAQKQWQRALCFFEALEEDGPPNALLRLTALDALEDASKWQKALQLLWADGADLALYLGCIRLLVRTGKFETALQIYGMMEDSGMIEPWESEWVLDLHGFTLEVAYVASSYALLSHAAVAHRPLYLVVGRGRGSDDGSAVLPVLSQILPLRDISAMPRNPGRLVISADAIAAFARGN